MLLELSTEAKDDRVFPKAFLMDMCVFFFKIPYCL